MPRSPLVAVDVVIFTIADGALQTLLVRVKKGPSAGRWAFPGGLVPIGEAPEATAARELETQTGLRGVYLEQLRTFGEPRRRISGGRVQPQQPCLRRRHRLKLREPRLERRLREDRMNQHSECRSAAALVRSVGASLGRVIARLILGRRR